jgi:hypothetical protein
VKWGDNLMVWRGQGIPILRTLRAYGAHKGDIFAVLAGEACKNSKNRQKMACAAGQNAGKREHGNALLERRR